LGDSRGAAVIEQARTGEDRMPGQRVRDVHDGAQDRRDRQEGKDGRALIPRGRAADALRVNGDGADEREGAVDDFADDFADDFEQPAARGRALAARDGASGFTEAVTARLSGGEIARRLPGVSVAARQITDLVINWQSVPTGLGDDGPLHQFVEHVDPTRVWVDEALYVHSEDDLRGRTPEQERNLLDAYRLRQVKNDVGVTEQFVWSPLIVARRNNPQDRGQNLVLIRDLTTYQVAMKLRWPRVEAIVYPELSDEDLRVIGLHLAMRGSAPSLEDLVRHLLELDVLDVQATMGRPMKGRVSMTLTDAARLLGCDRSYLGRMAKYLKDEELRGFVQAGVPSWVVIRASELLGATSLRDQALAEIHRRRLNGAQAVTFLEEAAQQARAARTPTAPRSVPAPAPPVPAHVYEALPPGASPSALSQHPSLALPAAQDVYGAPPVALATTAATESVRHALQAAAVTITQHWAGLCAARGEQVATALRDYVEGALETLD
jgi:hypothetical protein